MTNSRQEYFDVVILGAGIYGLYSALKLQKRKVLVLEKDPAPFTRASYINQARVHLGYHYPRSLSTALKSATYFERFCKDFEFAINNEFVKIYAISGNNSLTDGEQFKKFCDRAKIPCQSVDSSTYFNRGLVSQCFETKEYAFDAFRIRDYFLGKLSGKVQIDCDNYLIRAESAGDKFILSTKQGRTIVTPLVINATYASTNEIADLFGYEPFATKYEICEIILCHAPSLRGVGITVMDGPFFSLMPFGLNGLHSLTSVTFTPHRTSFAKLPKFGCQALNSNCRPTHLENCNSCPARPKSAWPYMSQIAKKYLITPDIRYQQSLFAIKPILKASEVDDSRPTVIKESIARPKVISVLSGKINTIYDLDKVLDEI